MRKSSWTFPGKARASCVVSLLFWLELSERQGECTGDHATGEF